MTDKFTITNVKNLSNEKANEMNKVAQYLKDISGILEGQKEKPHRDEGVAHRGHKVDEEVTFVYYKAVKGVSTIKDEEYASFVNPLSTINFDNVLQNVRKGNYGYMKETKTSQKSTNVYMRKYGLSIEVKPTLTEKRNVTQFIKATNWKRGNDYKKERVGPNDYEISIDKNGKGSVTLYKDNEKLKTIEFKINKDGKIVFDMVKLYQILEDGWLGVETLRALSVSLNHLAESNRIRETVAMAVEEPVQGASKKLKIAVSMGEAYSRALYGRDTGTIDTYNEIETEISKVYKIMEKMDYETEINIRRGNGSYLTDTLEIEKKLRNNIDEEKKVFASEVSSFEKEYEGKSDDSVKSIFILESSGTGPNIEIDFSEIDADFDNMREKINKSNFSAENKKEQIKLIEKMRKEIKNAFNKIAEGSNSEEEFMKKVGNSQIYGAYIALLRAYSHLPLEKNNYDTNVMNFEDAEKILREKGLLENKDIRYRFYKHSITENVNKKYVDLDGMKPSRFKRSKNQKIDEILYTALLIGATEREIMHTKAKRFRIQDTNITETRVAETPKEKHKKTEKIKEPAVVRMMPKKSPSQEELDALETNIKKSPLIANLYVQWFNKNAEKQGIKKRLSMEKPTELFDKMGVDFWKELKQPGPIMNKLLRDYELSLNEATNRKEYAEFENYVKMRTYEGKRTFNMQMDNLGGEKQFIAFQLYGVDFLLRDREEINREVMGTANKIERNRVECGAFQIFVNEYYGKKFLVVDNRIGDKTRSYMYDEKGNPSPLLMIYNQTREKNPRESTRLLDMASKNEDRKRNARVTGTK